MSNKAKLICVTIRITPALKKKARDLDLNISQIARHALAHRIKYLTVKARREAAQQAPEPIARALTPDQVTLAGSPVQVMPQCSGIGIPAEVILDQTIAELEKKGKDPEGSLPGEVTSLTDVQSTKDTVTPGTAEETGRERLHNEIV